jgi:hypothetical protein
MAPRNVASSFLRSPIPRSHATSVRHHGEAGSGYPATAMLVEVCLSPKDRRTVLAQLSRDRLGELTTRFELDVADRRSTDAHVDAIVRKRSLDFRTILEV